VFDHDGELVIGADDELATRRDGAWHVEREFGKVTYSLHVYDAIVERDAMWIATAHGLILYRDGAFSLMRLPNAPHAVQGRRRDRPRRHRQAGRHRLTTIAKEGLSSRMTT
jgi:hypothetical protein